VKRKLFNLAAFFAVLFAMAAMFSFMLPSRMAEAQMVIPANAAVRLAAVETAALKAGVTNLSANGASLISAADYAAMKALLDLEIGTDVQAYDADLTTYAGITPAANVQSLLGAANYAAMKVLLDLEIGTDVQAYDADLTTYAGITPAANVQSLLGAADYSAMKALLDLEIGTDVLAPNGNGSGLTALSGANVTAGSLPATAWESGAGVAALLSASLGGSGAYAKTADGAYTNVVAHGTKDRATLVVVSCTETFDAGTGTKPEFLVGETSTTDKFFAVADIENLSSGDVLVAAGSNTATKEIVVTATQATGNGAGAISVVVLAIPES
jgi:hypothetical protein